MSFVLGTPESLARDANCSGLSTPGLPSNFNYSSGSSPPSPRASDISIVVPRRIFVGGFPASTTEHELRSYFERYGTVRDVKIIKDQGGNVKGKYSYGFVTFETEEEAKKLIALNKTEGSRAFEFRGRYLNVNEAIKKPPINRASQFDAAPPSGVVLRDVNGQLFTVHNGYTVVASPDAYAVSQPGVPSSFPLVVQHPLLFTAPPQTPLIYSHQMQTAYATSQTGTPGPMLSQHPRAVEQQRLLLPTVPMQQPCNNQLPPTPISSPASSDSPRKMTNLQAINNLTNPLPTGLGTANPPPIPSSPYRWGTPTLAGHLPQLLYPPGGYPMFVHDYAACTPIQHQMNGGIAGFYPAEMTEYSHVEPSNQEFNASRINVMDNKSNVRMDSGSVSDTGATIPSINVNVNVQQPKPQQHQQHGRETTPCPATGQPTPKKPCRMVDSCENGNGDVEVKMDSIKSTVTQPQEQIDKTQKQCGYSSRRPLMPLTTADNRKSVSLPNSPAMNAISIANLAKNFACIRVDEAPYVSKSSGRGSANCSYNTVSGQVLNNNGSTTHSNSVRNANVSSKYMSKNSGQSGKLPYTCSSVCEYDSAILLSSMPENQSVGGVVTPPPTPIEYNNV